MAPRTLVVGPSLLFPWVPSVCRALARLDHHAVPYYHGNIWRHRLASARLGRAMSWMPGGVQGLRRGHALWRDLLDRSLIALASRLRPDVPRHAVADQRSVFPHGPLQMDRQCLTTSALAASGLRQ